MTICWYCSCAKLIFLLAGKGWSGAQQDVADTCQQVFTSLKRFHLYVFTNLHTKKLHILNPKRSKNERISYDLNPVGCFSVQQLRISNLGLSSPASREKFVFTQSWNWIFFKCLLLHRKLIKLKQARKLSRCDSYLWNYQWLTHCTHWPGGVGARRCYHI